MARTKKKQNKKKTLPAWKKALRILLRVGVFGFTFALLFVALVYLGLFGKIPIYTELTEIRNQTASIVYSVDDRMIGKYYLQNRLTIDNENISEHVKNALVATEDSRFFEHEGLDYISMARVMVKSLLLGDLSQGGGSTISQQLAKNLYPRTKLGWFTLPVGKIKEIFVAARLEKIYDKKEILALYLNTVPFGEDIYGIEVAANRFFNKSSSQLALSEAATLVGMLAANTAYNPRLHPERSQKRRNVVLHRMAENGFITQKEAEEQGALPIKTSYYKLDRTSGPAPYFLEKVRKETEDILKGTYGDTYDVYTQGLRIYTTLDATLQEFANEAIHQHMSYLQKTFDAHWDKQEPWHFAPSFFMETLQKTDRYKELAKKGWSEKEILEELSKPVRTAIFTHQGEEVISISPIDSLKQSLRILQAGFIAMDPRNGHVLAWQGGINYKFFQFDHVTASRQVGSTFKPIVYATALNRGYMPCEMIANEQRTYSDNWTPANADNEYGGYYSLKGGLVHSVNTIAAEVIDRVGVNNVITLARQLGIEATIPQVPSIALGTAQISLLEMVSAYSAFPNYGHAIKPVLILRIEDAQGKILYQNEDRNHLIEAFNEETAREMVQILREVVERGTAGSLYSRYNLKGDYAGKTGTTQNNSDGWFIGFTPNIVAGVWVGADQPIVRFRTTALGQGAHMALPIFARFMQKVENSSKTKSWTSERFYPLPPHLAEQMDCIDFLEDYTPREEMNFFERLFTPKKDRHTQSHDNDSTKEDKNKGLLNKVKNIFKKKNRD